MIDVYDNNLSECCEGYKNPIKHTETQLLKHFKKDIKNNYDIS
mgnify:CR=1 FL=1